MRKAVKGDKQAFIELYKQNIQIILYQVGKLLYVEDEKMDVAQEVILSMYSSISKLRNPEAFRTWMYRIIETTCASHNGKAGKRNYVDIGDYEDTSYGERPADVAERNETNRIVQDMIDELPEKQRLALFMYYYEDMSYLQIAKALDITISTVGTNIMKSKATLKKNMKKENIFPERTRKLDSMGLVILSAFKADVAGTVTSAQAEALIHACSESMADVVTQNVAFSHAAAKAGPGFMKPAIFLPVAVSASIGATAIVGHITGGLYAPDAVIKFTGAGSPSQVNPESATLVMDDGAPVRWSIVDEDGRSLASGDGTEIGGETFDLPEGDYTVEWIVADGKGRTATVRREITIN
ncbi:MAG: sigma-70 family RNA polymerase sigma factor [Clostridiales Family XIII bacterium]|nr:sigma-70 family RNA polymerase sigma factor [Clostridiales Family XIII bacterium]